MNIENYRAIRLCDNDDENQYGLIMLSYKHTINEFQQEVNNIKEKYYKNNIAWDISDILTDNELDKFNWFELPDDSDDYVVI